MSGNKVVKSVSFNVMNEQDKVYLERIQDVNFSGYVKQLIEKDIRQRKVIKAEIKPVQAPISNGRLSFGALGYLLNRYDLLLSSPALCNTVTRLTLSNVSTIGKGM
ncbi:hypothetical protein NDK43_25070 [Neobacillus pocheonensis]|uniref:Uncharacterized protein n=1 Tax=Neobacillus pocheonensis TaxID=363869 RepID=A0ABT0WHP3_9BACI|nr:hypothetical protein [Neobacillus pocheonensis]